MEQWLLMAFLALTGTATLSGSIKIIKHGEEALVETLGRYEGRKLEPGLHFITPVLDQVAFKETLREQMFNVQPNNCITHDNAAVTVDVVVYWRILDIEKAYYKIKDLSTALHNLVIAQIRAELGELDLKQTFTARAEINDLLLQELDVATTPWGVKVTRVELLEVILPHGVHLTMENQRSAERQKQTAILAAESRREVAIAEAKGDAEVELLAAETRQRIGLLETEAQQHQQLLKAQGNAQAMTVIVEQLRQDPIAAKALQLLLPGVESPAHEEKNSPQQPLNEIG